MAPARPVLRLVRMDTSLRGTVIVADESAPIRDYLEGLLKRALPGVARVRATCGAAACELIDSLSALPAEDRRPVVIVGRIRASNLADFELAEHAWSSAGPVRVVLLCDSLTVRQRLRARGLEATLIEDPVGFERLAVIVRGLLAADAVTVH